MEDQNILSPSLDSEIRQIQIQCLKLLDFVDNLCKDNGIQYSLCGGSVVGAHLYKGCLPWDDDVDLMMTRENYDRFIKIAPLLLPKGLSIHNYQISDDFTTPFTKIMNDETTIVQQDGTISGVFLDITVYDKIPHNFLANIDNLLWKLSQIVMIGPISPRRESDKIRNIVLKTPIGKKRTYLKIFEKAVHWISKSSSSYSYSELFGAFANTIKYKPEVFEHYTTIQFEDKYYMIVRDYIEYLKTRYNRTDFYEPRDKQIAPHYKYVNFDMPYKEYLNINGK